MNWTRRHETDRRAASNEAGGGAGLRVTPCERRIVVVQPPIFAETLSCNPKFSWVKALGGTLEPASNEAGSVPEGAKICEIPIWTRGHQQLG